MRYILLILSLYFSRSLFAQTDVEVFNTQTASVNESLQPSLLDVDEASQPSIELLIEDVDDLTATYAVSAEVELYASAENLFDLEMAIDRYDEDQLIDNTPRAVDEIYPVEGSSRFISAGIRFTF